MSASRITGVKRIPVIRASLAEAGIDKNLAHRARSLAAVPAEKFEELLEALSPLQRRNAHEKRRREDRRVALDPEVPAEADAAPGTETGCGELIARAAKGLAAENAALTRRVAALAEENSELKDLVKTWKKRAQQAGWKDPADASPGSG